MDSISSAQYSQSDQWEILETPWSVLDVETHGLKTLDIVPSCEMKAEMLASWLLLRHACDCQKSYPVTTVFMQYTRAQMKNTNPA